MQMPFLRVSVSSRALLLFSAPLRLCVKKTGNKFFRAHTAKCPKDTQIIFCLSSTLPSGRVEIRLGEFRGGGEGGDNMKQIRTQMNGNPVCDVRVTVR